MFILISLKMLKDNLKHEIHIIIEHNEILSENTKKDNISQLLSKYKHGNDIHKHRKQCNEWITRFFF